MPLTLQPSGPHLLRVAEVDDDTLVARLRQGDLRALEIMYERYARAVFQRCWRVLREREAAWDATQRTFIAFLVHLMQPPCLGGQSAREWLLSAPSRIIAGTSTEAGRR